MINLNNFIALTRLNKPIGIWLLLWPCFIGLALSESYHLVDYILFFLASIFLRSAGCAINDIFDAKFDSQVNRSKNRPLANKSLSLKNALIITIICLALGFLIFLKLSHNARVLSLLAAIMMVIYPLLKRVTYWPQIFLGFTFNIGFFITILHSEKSITKNHWFVYLALVLWTLFYDTIYAFADIKDDIKIGVKSSAIRMQKHPKFYLGLINILINIILAFHLKNLPIFTWCIGFLYNCYLLYKWNILSENSSIKTFKMCHFFGLGIWVFLEIIRIISPQ